MQIVNWNSDQASVISLPRNTRVLVEAGPGTGKTAVACARVAKLIEQDGLNPNEVVMISFTRAAVHEIRSRIGTFLKDETDKWSIRVTTLDSFTNLMRFGFSSEGVEFSSYEEAIKQFSNQLQTDSLTREFVASWRHLIIDEAQDVVSPRAELFLDLLDFLDPNCGVTVLYDDAQAIYGFSDDGDSDLLEDGATLPKCISSFHAGNFQEVALRQIHRTDEEKLVQFLKEARKVIKNTKLTGGAKRLSVDSLIGSATESSLAAIGEFVESHKDIDQESLILFRKRSDAISASSYFGLTPHRLRLSNRPPIIHPWIAMLFGDIGVKSIEQKHFMPLWERRIGDRFEIDPNFAWELIYRHAGEGASTVNLMRLAKLLSRSRPPEEFCLKDYGFEGPVIGTIHSSKGREADEVNLFLPPNQNDDDSNLEEEAKVLFVGASRARRRLNVGHSSFSKTKVLPSGRVFKPITRNGERAAQIEIGTANDISIAGLASRELFMVQSNVQYGQDFLIKNADSPQKLVAKRGDRDLSYAYFLAAATKPEQPIAFFDKSFNNDLFAVKQELFSSRRGTPLSISNIFMLGARTVAVDPDTDASSFMVAPWKNSCFAMAPIISGFPKLYF